MKKIIVILFFGLLIAQNNEINSLSEHNLVAPYRFAGEAALSVDNAQILLTP